MPVNLSLSNNTAAQHQVSKYGATNVAEDTREGDGKGGGAVALALVKTEGQKSMAVSCSGDSYIEEPSRDQIKLAYEQSCYDHDQSLSGYLKNEQRRTPDSMHEDAAGGEVSEVEVALGLGLVSCTSPLVTRNVM